MRKTLIILCLLAFPLTAQTNQLTCITGSQLGQRWSGALVYCPDSNRFLLSMGSLTGSSGTTQMPYGEMVFLPSQGRWINHLPDPALYGVWSDSTGFAYGSGLSSSGVFGEPYFIFKVISGAGKSFLRPNLGNMPHPFIYEQYAYDPEGGKVYFFRKNWTFSYDTRTRLWDTLSYLNPMMQQGSKGKASLQWGSLCWDPVNREVVLFGGGNVDVPDGGFRTWLYKPSTNTWSRPSFAVEPVHRAYTSMAYDAGNRVIVMFGGDHLDYMMNDTWVYACSTRTWHKKAPPLSPSPRYGHKLLYLPKSGSVVMLGGNRYTSCTSYMCDQNERISPIELWRYGVAADEWKLIRRYSTTDFKGSWPMCMNIMAAADTADRILLLADSAARAWSMQPQTWSLSCDPSVTDEANTQTLGVASDIRTYRTGGPYDPAWYDAGLAAPDTAVNAAFLSNLPLRTWTLLPVPKLPKQNRDWGTTVYAPDVDQILKWSGGHSAHCGTDVPQFSLKNFRWHIGFFADFPLESFGSNDGLRYYSFNRRPFMSGHTYDTYCYDDERHRMVMTKFDYTYTYDPVRMEWDSARIPNHAEMTGWFYYVSLTKIPGGVFGHDYTNFFFLGSDSMRWTKLPITGVTPIEYYGDNTGVCYDSKRHRIIIGRANGALPAKLYTYNLTTHVLGQETPANGTMAVNTNFYRDNVYLPQKDIVLYFAADSLANHLIYDCAANAWGRWAVARGPGVTAGMVTHVNSSLMYDAGRNLIYNSDADCRILVMRPDTLPGALTEKPAESAGALHLTVLQNPFNPMNTIKVSMSAAGRLRLSVYSADGRLIRKVADLTCRAGIHWLKWHGDDTAGRKVSAGLYVYRLEAGGKAYTARTVLAK